MEWRGKCLACIEAERLSAELGLEIIEEDGHLLLFEDVPLPLEDEQ